MPEIIDAPFRPFRQIEITIADDEWEFCGWDGPDKPLTSDRIVFSGALRINGTPHHLEGWAVTEENDIQTPVGGVQEFEDIYRAVGGDGSWQTITVGGRAYALVASPFCD